MIGAIIFAVLAVVLWAVYAYKTLVNWRLSSSLPPQAPGSRPLVGHYFTFGCCDNGLEVPMKKLARLGTEVGSMYTLKIGFRNLVVVNDFKTAVDACSGRAFLKKPLSMASLFRKSGLVHAQEKTWSANRRFCLKKLKESGFGGFPTEELCLAEAAAFVGKLKEKCGKPYDYRPDLRESIANVVGTVLVGPSFKDKNFAFDIPDLGKVLAPFSCADPRNIAPELRLMNMLAKTTSIPKLLLGHSRFQSYIGKLVEEARAAVAAASTVGSCSDKNSRANDGGIVGAYIAEAEHSSKHGSKNRKDPDSQPYSRRTRDERRTAADPEEASENVMASDGESAFSVDAAVDPALISGEGNITDVTADLLARGVDSLSSAVSWVIFVMCRHPDVQERVREELDSFVDKSERPVRYDDRDLLPYTRAVLCEVARFYPVVAGTISSFGNRAEKGEKIEILELPKGTAVYINLWAVLRDPLQWDTPDVFSPERFLDESGCFKALPESYCPFGVGQRACIGEPLALQLVFIYATAIVQAFVLKFFLPAGDSRREREGGNEDLPTITAHQTLYFEEGRLGLTYNPQPFKIMLTPRLRGSDNKKVLRSNSSIQNAPMDS